jgi:serine/threonine protein kinase
MCIKDTKIQTYANYYNFTLQQAIEKKKMKEGKFTESELAFVLSCLLDVGGYLKKEGIIFGDFRPEQIFLTPEGYIKIYLLDI